MSSRTDILPRWREKGANIKLSAQLPGATPGDGTSTHILSPRAIACIFATKTMASGLLALLVAFAFNLDQPRWALITVFIVARPQSGFVLAKSFYRIIGTLVGAAGALVLVSLFAQERTLFLGALAIWIALCTFASKQARNFAAYGFVLSGYTVAIVGIPGALDAGSAFYIAVARVTEISLGIMTTAVISHLVVPVSLADALRRTVAVGRTELVAYVEALLGGGESASLRAMLLSRVIEIENMRASAIFEDREIERRRGALRRLDIAMLEVIDVAHLLGCSLDRLRRGSAVRSPDLDEAIGKTAAAIDLWHRDRLDAAGLKRHLVRASVKLPLARELYHDRLASDDEVVRGATAIGRMYDFFAVIIACAEAYEALSSPEVQVQHWMRFSVSNDFSNAVWAGLRAGMALMIVGMFWILTNWPSGSTATILASLVTARLATMDNALRSAIGATFLLIMVTVPYFVIVEMLLPTVSGFGMFALIIAPVLLSCAYFMAYPKTEGIGFVAALFFAYASAFLNRMSYDPVGFLNISIACTLAIGSAAILFAIVAPETREVAQERFIQAVRRALEKTVRQEPQVALTRLRTSVVDALDQLCRVLRSDRSTDLVAIESSIAIMGAGRELIRVLNDGRSTPANREAARDVVRFVSDPDKQRFDSARRSLESATGTCLAELRADNLGVSDARAASRELVAFAAIREELERSGCLLLSDRARGAACRVA